MAGSWPPLALENAEPDLAVARGAALYGKFVHRETERIEAGARPRGFPRVLGSGRLRC